MKLVFSGGCVVQVQGQVLVGWEDVDFSWGDTAAFVDMVVTSIFAALFEYCSGFHQRGIDNEGFQSVFD